MFISDLTTNTQQKKNYILTKTLTYILCRYTVVFKLQE